MRHSGRFENYLGHIEQAIDRATLYLKSLPDLEAFETNTLVQDAVIRNIEIIGEAVSKIGSFAPDFIREHAQIPWAQMPGMRNVVIHAYFFVDLNIVWTTVKNDLPFLKDQIDALLNNLQRDP